LLILFYLVYVFVLSGDILQEYEDIGHPYVADYSITSGLSWVLCMSPFMSQKLSQAEFIEMDITYNAAVEFQYLMNAVAFDYTTLRCKYQHSCTYIGTCMNASTM